MTENEIGDGVRGGNGFDSRSNPRKTNSMSMGDMYWLQTGATHYHVQLGLLGKCCV